MRFPPEFIERLKHHVPISQVIGRRIPVKRHGREFQALCPFHKEKSPSFTVNDDKGFFHCFGCGAHGDAIGFVKDFDGISYPEAVERLAGEAGLPVPKMTREAEAYERKRHTLEEAVAQAAQWFVRQLQTPVGVEARDYVQSRGLTPQTVERFGLGFAPNQREALKSALMQQGIPEALLVEAGLIIAADDGRTYDRFRGRLMFPIKNAQGRVVAFGGRILASAQTPNSAKYLNSPETPLFKKGEMLFAYDIARGAAREQSLIVAEGYMDVIALHQAGFTTAVAPLGTAITESQLQLLWRISSEPILCLDGDSAGLRAMQRAAQTALPLLKAGYGLRFALLPAGEDPDSLLSKAGRPAMQETLVGAKVLSQVLWDSALAQYGSQTAEKKAALEQSLMQTAERISDSVLRSHMRDFFRQQLYGVKSNKNYLKTDNYSGMLRGLPAAEDDTSNIKKLENQLISLILLQPSLLQQGAIEEALGHMDLMQATLDRLRRDILEISAHSELADSLSIQRELAGRGHSETVDMLLQQTARNLPRPTYVECATHPQAALSAWMQTLDAYTDKLEDREIALLAREVSEDANNKIVALKKQKEERQRARYAHTSDEQAS